ncbi:MAG: hypothetical protein ACREAC_25285, partial [Blastocatellia bacterium]
LEPSGSGKAGALNHERAALLGEGYRASATADSPEGYPAQNSLSRPRYPLPSSNPGGDASPRARGFDTIRPATPQAPEVFLPATSGLFAAPPPTPSPGGARDTGSTSRSFASASLKPGGVTDDESPARSDEPFDEEVTGGLLE